MSTFICVVFLCRKLMAIYYSSTALDTAERLPWSAFGLEAHRMLLLLELFRDWLNFMYERTCMFLMQASWFLIPQLNCLKRQCVSCRLFLFCFIQQVDENFLTLCTGINAVLCFYFITLVYEFS